MGQFAMGTVDLGPTRGRAPRWPHLIVDQAVGWVASRAAVGQLAELSALGPAVGPHLVDLELPARCPPAPAGAGGSVEQGQQIGLGGLVDSARDSATWGLPRGTERRHRALLPVVLDGIRVAHFDIVGIHPELSAGTPLPQQVPALIQRLFQLAEAQGVRFVERQLLVLRPKFVFLGDQPIDRLPYLFVVHWVLPLSMISGVRLCPAAKGRVVRRGMLRDAPDTLSSWSPTGRRHLTTRPVPASGVHLPRKVTPPRPGSHHLGGPDPV